MVKLRRSISDFQIPGQSFIKGNSNNLRTSDDTDMKPGIVTKLYRRNKATSKLLRWRYTGGL